mgnify:CR=1 FL=1
MKKLLYSILALIFISSTANANIYDDCEAAVSANDLDKVKKLAEAIKQSPKIPVSKLKTARLCVSTAAGEPMIFISATKSFISLVEYEALNAKKSLSDSEKIAEHRAQQREEQAKRIALKAMKEKAAKLRKQLSCMNIKSSEIITKVEAIEKQNQDTNNFLILQDTHKSCSILYGDNKSAAMLNQSCIDAFKSMGHPSLVLGEVERKSVYSNELSGLMSSIANAQKTLEGILVTLLEAESNDGKTVAQQSAAYLREAKSCAEFGYEGVYLD